MSQLSDQSATFSDVRTLAGEQARVLVSPIAARYEKCGDSLAGEKVTVTVSLTGGSSSVWDHMPNHASPAFLRAGVRVSVAIQRVLRDWLPYIWFSDASKFADYDTASLLLMYSSCRVFTAKTKHSFTFDVLDDDTPRAMQFSISRNLAARLEGIEPMLSSLGMDGLRYAPRRAERMTSTLPFRRQEMNALLVAERELIEGYLGLNNNAKRERSLVRIERILRKLFLKKDFSQLRPLFDWEAQYAAAQVLGLNVAFDAKIFANSDELPALSGHENSSAAGCPDDSSHLDA